jgi:hypothetical protein
LAIVCALLSSTVTAGRSSSCGAWAKSAGGHDVADLIGQAPTSGRFNVAGYVVRVYLCPACPPGAACKPCLGDHLVVSDQRHVLAPGDDLGASDVLIFGARADLQGLKIGNRYEMEVDVRGARSARQSINDLTLVRIPVRVPPHP